MPVNASSQILFLVAIPTLAKAHDFAQASLAERFR